MPKRVPLSVSHSDLVAEWLTDKNDLSPDRVSKGSTKKVWWKCPNGHEYEARIDHRTSGSGCPYCAGQKAYPGETDLATLYPDIAAQLIGADPTTIVPTSSKKYDWKCEEGHTWKTSSKSRVLGRGCPECTGRKLVPGKNDLATTHPDVAKRWHPSKNSISPTQLRHSSDNYMWWICDNGHEWKRTVWDQAKYNTCPYCTGKRVIPGETDLEGLHPSLYAELVNKEVLFPGSGKKVLWRCTKDHQWESTVKSRVMGTSCPYCSGRLPIPGKTDLATLRPDLSKQWHPDKNSLTPQEVTVSASNKVWWRCENGHEWEAYIYSRSGGSGCAQCSTPGTSDAEKSVAIWLESLGFEVVRGTRKIIPPFEVDIYLPEYKFAIEFNGIYCHSERMGKDKNYHADKVNRAQEEGVRLVQVWEDDWTFKQEIIKSMILHRLGASSARRVYARNTTATVVDERTANFFLEENHIQGGVLGANHFGLIEKKSDTLVAVISFRSTANGTYLERYATSTLVTGGFTKVLKYAVQRIQSDKIVTFADLEVSNGELYEKSGFKKDEVIPPDYAYVVRGRRVHKFNYRIERFRTDPNLKFREGMSERDLALLNGITRVWDSGKIRYVLELKDKENR